MTRNETIEKMINLIKIGSKNLDSELCEIAIAELKDYKSKDIKRLFKQVENMTNYDMSSVILLLELN